MGSIVKTIIGLLIALVLGSYLIATGPVSNALQAGQKKADPLVSGARAVKQEVRTITDEAHQEAYKKAVQQGLRKVVNVLNQFTGDKPEEKKTVPQKDRANSL